MPRPRKAAAPPLVEALAAALAADGGAPVERRETHSAWVLLTPDRAVKLKKPVRYAFLDYSTPERRRAACEAELRVNRPLAPGLVRDVLGVHRAPHGGVALGPPDGPGAIDWVVVMRRYDEGRTMAALVDRGELTDAQVRAAAARVARFHAVAEVVREPDPVDRVRAAVARNADELRAAAGDGEPGARAAALGAFLLAGLGGRSRELAARARAGLVRDGHGDLRAEHVVFEGPEPIVVDRIEFDPALRRVDVADDLSFLAMDLESLGVAPAARLLVDAYREAGGDPGPPALVALFGAHHALVRAKVALLRAAGRPAEARDGAAARLLGLAARLAWRGRSPFALVVCGPPASGKSTLAAALAARSGLEVLSSDAVRRESRAGPAPAEAYTRTARAAVYEELGRRTRARLDEGRAVIVEATFGEPALRAAFLAELHPSQRPGLYAAECRAPRAVLRARAAAPRAGGSDAGPEVAERLARAFTPPVELGADRVTAVDGTAPADRAVAAIEAWLPAGAGAWRDPGP